MFMLQHSQSNCSLKHNTQILYLAYAGRYSGARVGGKYQPVHDCCSQLGKLEPSSAAQWYCIQQEVRKTPVVRGVSL